MRELKRERTRRLIADKAFELFTDHGFGRTTVSRSRGRRGRPETLPVLDQGDARPGVRRGLLLGAVAWFREQPEWTCRTVSR